MAENIINGLVETKYPNGNIKTVSRWKDGKLHGSTKTFFLNGKVESIAKYKLGKKVGRELFFYDSGVIKSIYFYFVDKEIPLKHNEYNPDGILITKEIIYLNEKLRVVRKYDVNGKALFTKKYKNDKLIYSKKFKDGLPLKGRNYK